MWMPPMVVGSLDFDYGQSPVLRLTPGAEFVLAKSAECLSEPGYLLLQWLIAVFKCQCDEAEVSSFRATEDFDSPLNALVGYSLAARWAKAILACCDFGAEFTTTTG